MPSPPFSRSRFPSYPMNIDPVLQMFLEALRQELERSFTETLIVTEIELTSPLAVPSGGTGRASLTNNALLTGQGTSDVGFVEPGADGRVPRSNGTIWVSVRLTAADIDSGTFPGTYQIAGDLTVDGDVTAAQSPSETLSFHGATPTPQQTVSGSRSQPEDALANLLTALANLGLIVDNTTANPVLAPADASHAHTVDSPVLGVSLLVDDTTHSHTAESPTLVLP